MSAKRGVRRAVLAGSSRYGLRTFFLVSTVVLLLSAACATCVSLVFRSWSERGLFGDMFGVVNALLSSLALAGVIVTILLQGEELRLQRQVLRDSARLSALSILIPILRRRAEEAPEEVRDSEGYQRLVNRLDELEEELNLLAVSPGLLH